jgi:hypothetical protein
MEVCIYRMNAGFFQCFLLRDVEGWIGHAWRAGEGHFGLVLAAILFGADESSFTIKAAESFLSCCNEAISEGVKSCE